MSTELGQRSRAMTALEAAGWPSVADDLNDGLSSETVLSRLRGIDEGDSEAARIVAEADLPEAPPVNERCTGCDKPANERDSIVVDGEVYCDDDCAPPEDEPTAEQLEAYANYERRSRFLDTLRSDDGGLRRWWQYR